MAGDGASIGEVYVDILPKADNFWTKVQAQVGPQADRFGTELGKSIGDRIAKGIKEGLGAGFSGSPGREQGKRTGDDFAGEFDRTVRTRIAAALKALPKAEIGAATTEAEQKIRDLRVRLEELSNKRIGVDIDEAAAREEIRALRDDLARLARESPSVRVTADTGRASAELEALRLQIDRIKATSGGVTVNASTGGSSGEVDRLGQAARDSAGGMGNLLAAGIALGPGIIPVAAAVTAAIAGIGAGALGVVGGISVVLLATHGIGDAVSAMGAAQQNAAKDAATLAGRQVSLASASDSVRSAQGALGQAVANAADAQRRAAESVGNAEQSLADAQRQARQAQLDLTAARKAEVQAEEDLKNSIVDNANEQRRASIDQIQAKQQLDAVLANPASSQLQREEAQLTFDEAVQHGKELVTQAQRLEDQQKHATQVGVDGSTQVLAAQDRVRSANEQAGKAEQALNDARIAQAKQQRDSAYAIAQAQQGVISAQRSLQQATVQAGAAGSTSMDELRLKLAALTPEGQRFAAFLYSLGPVVKTLSSTAQAGLLPGLQDGITAVLPLLPIAIRSISQLSTTVGTLASEAGHALASPYWVSFFTFLSGEANPALIVFGHSVGNVAVGVSGLVRAFAPLGQEVGVGLLHFTQDFAHWSTTLSNSSGFIAFLAYVQREGPVVVATVGNLVTTTGHLVAAAAPIGDVVLVVLRDFSGLINAIPIPILTAAGVAIVGIVVAMKTWQLAQSGLNGINTVWTATLKGLNAVTAFTQTAIFGVADSTSKMAFGFSDAVPKVSRFGGALQAAKTAASDTKGGLGSLGSFLTGPWGIALGAAAVGLGLLAARMAEQKAKTDAAIASYERFGDAVARARLLGQKDNAPDLISQDKDLQELILDSNKYGISSETVVNALAGQRDAYGQVTAALAKHRAELATTIQEHTVQGGKGQRVMDATAMAAQNEVNHLDALSGKFGTVAQDQARAKDAADLYNAAQAKSTDTTYQQTVAQQALGVALNKVSDSTATAVDKADALQKAQEAIYGAAQAADQAEEALAASEGKLNEAVQRSSDAHLTGAHSLNIHTQAGRDNRDALIAQLKASDDEYFTSIRNGTAVDEATKKHDQETDALRAQAKQLGLNSGDVEHLIGIYGLVPTDVKTQITVAGAQEALTQLQNLEIAQLALRQGIPIDQATKEWTKQHKAAGDSGIGGLAAGGPVFGPGGPTDDMIPARLSAGEHVWTAREVDAAGGHRAVEAIRQAVVGTGWHPQTRYPGDGSHGLAFAKGGPVIWPFPTNAAITRIPSQTEIEQAVLFGPAFTGSVGANLTAAAAFVKSQVGKPYLWASAGPNGYDCSGIGSGAWNVAHGRSPYSHTFSTSNEAGFFPLPGYGPFTAAWTNPGEPGPGGNSVGHTAFRIGNYAFESTGSGGVHDGASVTPLSAFAHIGHFDDGGPLYPGLTLAYNGTGAIETVRTAGQEAALAASMQGRGGGGIHLTVNPPAGASTTQIVDEVMHELVWADR